MAEPDAFRSYSFVGMSDDEIHSVISDEIFPLLQRGKTRIEFRLPLDRPALPALLSRCGPNVLLSYGAVVEQPIKDHPMWNYRAINLEEWEALVEVVPGDPESRVFGLWIDAHGRLGTPSAPLMEKVGGVNLRAMGYYPRGSSAFGTTPAEQLAACAAVIERLEAEHNKGYGLVVFLAVDMPVAYAFGMLVQGAGRFPDLTFVEMDADGEFTARNGRT